MRCNESVRGSVWLLTFDPGTLVVISSTLEFIQAYDDSQASEVGKGIFSGYPRDLHAHTGLPQS